MWLYLRAGASRKMARIKRPEAGASACKRYRIA